MFKRINWILTSFDGPTKIPFDRSFYVEVHCAVIKHENGKAKPTHYFVQSVDLDHTNDQCQEWFLE